MALGESDTDSVDSVVGGKRKRGEIQETEEIDSGGCGGEIAKIDSDGCCGEISKIDSGGCGGKIAKVDSGGGDIAKIDSGGGSAMKEEKETRQVLKFVDRYNLFQRYNGKMPFEDETYDPTRNDDYSSEEDGKGNLHMLEGMEDETGNDAMVEDTEEDTCDRETILKYISQVRNSFGFDVDVRLPSWLVSYLKFVPADVSDPIYHDHVHRAARFAIEEINVDLESKTYEFVEIAKAVYVYNPGMLMFLTLVVKKAEAEGAATMTIQAIVNQPIAKPFKLDQWMFKLDASP
ncbi:hypothetical protein SASPL_106594 [Salvia splendens]|uniref:Uncharacterized protein n=1 Tax=Salvia splendens TaxID=180675 RepID=A0A8X8YNX2_SALSN|nr:uncharacterized protein LOC121792954 [Salvia splendens]KAG6434949.1 hypothetical protein SASPL_106594 [Salvia splendens]